MLHTTDISGESKTRNAQPHWW